VTVQDLIAELSAWLGPEASIEDAFGLVTVDVAPATWREAAAAVRDRPSIACGFFDWLSAYDDNNAGIAIVAQVWSLAHKHAVTLRTHVEREAPELDSLTTVWRGADWHERETFEMFGVRFAGHPHLVPLLLPNGFEGNPLRKEFVLASRVAKAWPGAKEPGQSDADLAAAAGSRRSRRLTPPGVPDPAEWGPEAGERS
jgi:NADH-quinone oxidoreductase subunit C